MADSPLPTTWKEAVPYIVWGVLIFSCGLEGVVTIVEGKPWWVPIGCFAAMLALTAVAIHSKELKEWLSTLDVRWLVSALLVALIGVILSPFIEQKRWPFHHFTVEIESAAPIPTSLKLQFDATGKVHEIETKNLSWRSANLEETRASSNLSTTSSDILNPKCPSGEPYGRKPLLGLSPSLSDPTICIDKIKSWVFFLTFDQPITFKKIKLNSHGASLPEWDNKGSTSHSAVLWINGEPKNMVLDIEMVE